jgi:hypothetical protein
MHGIAAIFFFGLLMGGASFVAALAWLALNLIPILAIKSWTFDRAMDAFNWTSVVWMPIAFAASIRELPRLLGK